MKKSRTIQLSLVTVISLMLLNSCHKKNDKLPDVSSLCKVVTITTEDRLIPGTEYTLDTLHITYNAHGDPAAITRLTTHEVGSEFEFRYDHTQRLTDVISGFFPTPNGGVGFGDWYKLYYANGRIVLDTLFDLGLINGDRPDSLFPQQSLIRQISTYEYDWKGRISRARDYRFRSAWECDNCNFVVDNFFSYNSSGNLDKITMVTQDPYPSAPVTSYILVSGYDNKINVDRTHPTWQFLDRDYSENNNFHADHYNEAGLPTVATQPETLPIQSGFPRPFSFVNGIFRPFTIEYSCCQPPGGNGGHGY